MALSNEEDTTQLASPRKKKNVPVVARVTDLIDTDPHSELIFETPPPDVVNSINECFEQFTSTLEKKSDAPVHEPSSDSDSDGWLFMTQSVTKAVQTIRRHKSESICDSGNVRDNGDTENERESGCHRAECLNKRKYLIEFGPRRAIFPFLKKPRQHLPLRKYHILENSEMGGFLKCVKKIEEGYVNKERAISPSLLESELSDNSEEDDHNSDHEVTIVDREIFVPGYFKGNKHKWLPQSSLEMRIQDSLLNDNEQQLIITNGKDNKTSASGKKQSKKKHKDPKSKGIVRTSSKSSVDSLFKEQEKQHETQEVLAACSDAEHSDSAHCSQRLTKQIVQCAKNLHHSVVIEETQRNSIELITEAAVHIEHEDDVRSPSQVDLQSTSKQKMKKKHQLKGQKEAEPGSDTRSVDNVHLVEMDQFSDSQTTEKTPKRTKKKRKDKDWTKRANVEDESGTDILLNETFEVPVTKQPEHMQTSEDITGCLSPYVPRLKSGKKKQKNGCEESQYESIDFPLDVSSVSQFDNAITEPAVEYENDLRPNNYLPTKSNSMLAPQGGDISIQSYIQQTDNDFGSQDLFRPLNSQKHKTNEFHKAASITANTEESDQDSDVTQIETEGPFKSIFGQGTTRWSDGDTHAHEGDKTQRETEGQSVSVFGAGTPNKQFTTQDMYGTIHPGYQKTDQSPIGLNAELLSSREEKVKSDYKKRETMSRSLKDSEDTGVEETVNVQPSSKHLPLADEPLREVYSSPCVRHILGKQRARAEMETDVPESPLFKNYGLSFIKRKRNRKDNMGASDLIQCDSNVDVSSESPVDNITGDKTTPGENEKSCEVNNKVTNEEQREASVLHLEETSELLEESILSMEADNTVTTKVKRKKKKKYKLNEDEDETVQFSESQSTELISKVTKKKKRKDKEKTKLPYVEENSATDIPSSETLDSDRPAELRVNEVNQTSEAPETDLPETSEEITGCPTPNVTALKSVKKNKKKKRDETEEPEYEPVDLDGSSVSQFDHVAELKVVEQQDDQFFKERPSDKNTAEILEGNTPHILKVAKHKKKSQNSRPPSQSDDIALEKQAEELLEKKKMKKQKEHKNAELTSDIGDNVQLLKRRKEKLFQHSESQTMDLLSRKTKKKRANKDKERTTVSSSNELLEHMDDGHSEIRGNLIQSTEDTENNQLEHLQTEEITGCLTPNVARLKSGKKKKNGCEESQYESVDLPLDLSSVSQFGNVTDRSTTLETVEERPSDVVDHTEAELNHAERLDSVQYAENLDKDHLEVIKGRQRKTVEAVTKPPVEHENDMRLNNYLPNKSNSMLPPQGGDMPPQGGDISIQNYIQQTDSDFGSQDLFRPLNKCSFMNLIGLKFRTITANTEESDQDSDVTQIETEGPFESTFGQGISRWWDGDTHAHEDNSDKTRIETEGQSVSVFGAGTPNKQFTTQDVNSTKHLESQKTDQNPVGLNVELLSRRKEKDKSNKTKRKTMSSSHKNSKDTGVEETVNVQQSPLPLDDEPLREVNSSPCVRHILGKRRARVEMETDLPEIPLFSNGSPSFIKKKAKRNDKMGASGFIQCDTNADLSSKSPVNDISEDKTPGEKEKFCEVENRVTNEEQREALVLHLEETSELLEESILSVEADKSITTKVKRKKKKRYKLNEHEDGVENQSVETVQFNESQSTELISKVTKQKKRKYKEKTKLPYVEENSAKDIPSSETLDSDRPAELTVKEINQTSEAPETDLPETSEETTECPTPNVNSLKSVKKKKKKKKRDETEEPEYESVDLDVSSVSQFDHVAEPGVVELQDDQFFEERLNDKKTAETLEGNTPHILKLAKRKKKSQNSSSPSQSDDIFKLEKQASGSQSESAEEHLKKKKIKKQKLKEQKNAELASDIGDYVQLFQQSDSQTTDLLSRKSNKKRANKDKERTTVSSSNELSEHMDDGRSEMRGNVIQSTEDTENDQLEHLQTSEEITRCPSPNVTKLSSGKKKKKKRDTSEKHQDESVDVELDVSSMIERRPNTVEHVENMNSPALSDSTFTSKKKRKKKHKLKEQEEAEPGVDTHSVDNVYSVEMDQFIELQTSEMTPKRTKKKRKDKERTKTAHLEDNRGTDILLNETFEASETEQPEHIQTSEEITGCPSPNITKLKSEKKKKKNGSKESQYESVDFALDVSSVSQETVEERPSDVVELTEAELNDTKHKKKRKRSSLSGNNSSDAQMQETVAPERKRKKKRNSDYITNVCGELTLESSDHTVPQKSKRKKNKEMSESTSHVLDDSAELETVQTKRTDSTQTNVITSLGDYVDTSKKKKKR
ncbi:phoenix [Garra rufa]|uniref:phoenix n=1 Tax=Garra rufa TaxID=137080 RepID=UPI003CCECE47